MGYSTKTCEAGQWYMIGCGFEKTGGGSINIQDFITGLTARSSNPAAIQVWDGTGLKTYNYIQILDTTTWKMKPGWAQGSMAVNFDVAPGWACWFRDPVEDVTITVAGQISETAEKTVVMEPDSWYMVANPYPVATKLNDGLIDWSGIEARSQNSATIQFWNGTALDTYNFIQILDTTTWKMKPGWAQGSMATGLEIPAQTGFWIRVPLTGGSFIWNSPIK